MKASITWEERRQAADPQIVSPKTAGLKPSAYTNEDWPSGRHLDGNGVNRPSERNTLGSSTLRDFSKIIAFSRSFRFRFLGP